MLALFAGLLPAFIIHVSLYASSAIASPAPLPLPTDPPTQPKPLAERAVQPATATRAPSDDDPLGGIPSGLRSLVNPLAPLSRTPGCEDECIVVYPSVNIFYWATKTPNTACLSTITHKPPRIPQPTGMVFPSVYAVYPRASWYNKCGERFVDDTDTGGSTDSHPVGYLQTYGIPSPGASAVAKVFNYDDLPCPPESIQDQIDPGFLYSPVLQAPFHWTIDIVSGNKTGRMGCKVAAVNDPPVAATVEEILTGPDDYDYGMPP